MMADFREIGPTFVLFAPRVWEQLAAEVRAKVMDASPFKRRMFDLGMKMGLEAVDKGRRSAAADALLFRALRDRLGFSQPHLGRDRRRGARPRHLPLLPGDGRAAAPALRPDRAARRLHAAPRAARSISTASAWLRRDDRAAHRQAGPERRRRDRDAPSQHVQRLSSAWTANPDLRDGWLHTGDAGYFAKTGRLVVIDRIKDIAETAGGDRFSPNTSRTS
jgi:long-chain acyl-CoA synthetase